MNILYGVVGEGMGHATRSRVVLGHLSRCGHKVKVVVSGRAHGFLTRAFDGDANVSIQEIHGLHLAYEDNAVDKSASLWSNLAQAPAGVVRNVQAYASVLGSFDAQVVISDFESFAWLYARAHRLPVISIDNMQILNRCRHPREIKDAARADFELARLAVKSKLPGAWHYLVSSFFFPPVRKPRTSLIPPILRPEILAARPEPGDHVLVYQTAAANTALLPALQRLGGEFRLYGMGREGTEGNVSLRPFSEQGFIEDLRTAKAVIAGGGYSLMGECVHLGVPMFAVPLEAQFEQILNAQWLQALGYGDTAEALDVDRIASFLADLDGHRAALASYTPRDDSMLFACVDELLADVAEGTRKDRLITETLGTYEPEED